MLDPSIIEAMRSVWSSLVLVPSLLMGCGADDVQGDGTSQGSTSGDATVAIGSDTAVASTDAADGTASGSTDGGRTDGGPTTDGGTTDGGTTDGGLTDADTTGAGSDDASTTTDGTGTTGAVDCSVGERVYQGDGCNFCDCTDEGLANCTTRTCVPISDGCMYNGMQYAYAETFDSTDRCNACVCAASGLACTRRPECVDGLEEGAILLETLDATCGDIDGFTGQSVLDLLEPTLREGPLDYANAGPLYPETLADTTMSVRITYVGGYVVCRVPALGQEALDIEAIVEWQTSDGAFDEGQQTYIRDNAGGFLDAITSVSVLEPNEIHGSYDNDCLGAGAISFAPRYNDDGTATGTVLKTCEVDIGLTLGDWTSPS